MRAARASTVAGALAALAALTNAAAAASAAGRAAIVIGSNEGLSGQPVLEFAESDAQRMARVFVEVGAVAPGRVSLLLGRPLNEVREALRRAAPVDELWVFISGHADARGVDVRGEVLPWPELRRMLEALPAQRRIAFIDVCHSGAVLTAKGISLESQLRLSAQSNIRGLVLLVSSGANELSYESRQLQSSPFAHFLASALRGAADTDHSGRVSVAEAYAYLYARTVAASLGGAGGPQHPEQAGWYQGSGEWVLAQRPEGQGEVRLSDESLGTCYLLDAHQTRVLGEVRATDAAPMALPAGRYSVHCATAHGLRVAELELGVATAAVEALTFEAAPSGRMVRRGGAEQRWLRVGSQGGLEADARVALLEGTAVLDMNDFSLGVSAGGLGTDAAAARVTLLGRMPWWRLLGTRLDVGLAAGYATRARQGEAWFGTAMQLSVPVGEAARLFVRQDVLRSVALHADEPTRLPLLTQIGFDLGWPQ